MSRNKTRLVQMAAAVVFGTIPVISGFLAGWWLSFTAAAPEKDIGFWALLGLGLGALVDLLFLKSWSKRFFSLPFIVWALIYLFYSIGCFGVFMGVPVMNLALPLPAGIFMGARLAGQGSRSDQVKAVGKRTALFTTIVLAVVCITSAAIALLDPHTPANLQGMFGLGFPVTWAMVIALILVGGTSLLAINWWLTRAITLCTHTWLTPDEPSNPPAAHYYE